MNPSVPPVPSVPPSAPATAKKSLPIWAWFGIGCGCLVVLAILVVGGLLIFGGKKALDFAKDMEDNPAALVELVVKMNPEVELVETDNDAQKMTIRNKKTGEVATFDFSDIQNGNFSFEGADGSKFTTRGEDGKLEVTGSDGQTATFSAGQGLDDVPSWVHVYPGAEAEVGFTQQGSGQATGVISQTTDDSSDDIAAHFEAQFEALGWEVTKNQFSGGGQKTVVITGRSADGTYTEVASAVTEDGKTQIGLQYTGPAD